jgi:uncharacterized membrane protein YhaH (DUF805 family)
VDLRKLLFSPHGRIGRQSFWLFTMLVAGTGAVTGMLDLTFFGLDRSVKPISSIFQVLTIFPGFCIQTKRLHDLGRSGWLLLIPYGGGLVSMLLLSQGAIGPAAIAVALTAGVFFIWLGFFKGSPGPNKYGEPNSGDRDIAPPVEIFS